LALLFSSVAGCGGASFGVPIQGHVSYRGEAISHGTLTFFPVSGRPISASLSSDGEYIDRLPPGQYRVTITVGVDMPDGWKEGDPVPSPNVVLPSKYTVRSRSPLKMTVAENLDMPIDFALE
jgi:hypothetical protein